MQLSIVNLTGSTKTYLSGAISVPGSGTTAVTNAAQQLSLSTDGQLHSDLLAGLVQLTDGVNTYGANDALDFLKIIPTVIVALADSAGNGITSTSVSSKQRLDSTTASEGTTGSTVPTYGTLVAGKNAAGNLQSVTTDRDNRLNTSNGTDKSVFGPQVVASRVQQLVADFSETLTNNNITQTVTGTGVISLATANASISTGNGATASAQITTIGSIDYLPGREMYAQYTAAFTTPTSAASTQYTGLYNGTDGLLIGYNGLNFSIATVAGGVFTNVNSSSFNVDTLTGAATSLFTRGGTPEAVNFTFKNIYRIRAGWLGAAPIFFEIMSPDGNWVTFHIVRVPNTSVNPVFLEPSLPFTMFVTKTSSDATNLKIITTSWDAGVVDISGQTDTSDSGSITALNGTVVIGAQSQSTIVADITGTWSGTIQVQGDVGDGTWNSIFAVSTTFITDNSFTSNNTLIIPCAGYASVRLIATAWSSGTALVNWVATQGLQAVTAIAMGNVASGAADSGNPVKIGGVYNSTLPSPVSGSRVDVQSDFKGRLLISPVSTSYFHPIYSLRVQVVLGNNGSNGTSLNIPIASTSVGNLIAVAVATSVAGTVTVTDNLSQTYSTAVSGTSGTHTSYIFYKANTAAGVTSITISSTSSTAIDAIVTEYFGITTSSPLDKTSTGNVSGASAFSSGATAATTSAVELLLGTANGTTKNNSTYTAGTGWNTVGLSNGFNAGAGQLYMEDQYVGVTGAYTATGTASANDTIIADIATFTITNTNLTPLNQPKVIKSGAGNLRKVVVNTIGTGSPTLTLYDNTTNSGTIIAVISLLSAVGSLVYDLPFANGLTIVVNSTTADFTIVYD